MLGPGAVYSNILDLILHFGVIVGDSTSQWDTCTMLGGCVCWQKSHPVGWSIRRSEDRLSGSEEADDIPTPDTDLSGESLD